MITGFGTRKLGNENLTMFSVFNWLNRSHPMPYQLEASTIAERMGANTSRLFCARMLDLVVGVLLTSWIFPYTLYIYGVVAGELLGQIRKHIAV